MWDDPYVPLYGRSAPTEKGFSSVEDLRAVLDHLRIRRASLLGLSLGGRIAIDFTLAYPQRVDKLVLMGPTGYRFKIEDDQWHLQCRTPYSPSASVRSPRTI